MLSTSKRRVTSRLSSMFSLPIRILPSCSWAISSNTGEIILHGPHHSAQKSTRTGTSEALTFSSNVASVKVSIFSLIASPCRGVQRRTCAICSRSLAPLLEPALGVDGGHAAGPGRGDRLAVVVVLHVAAGEDAVDAGPGRAVERLDVPVGLQLQLTLEERAVGFVADGDEEPVDGDLGGVAAHRVLEAQAADLGVPEDLGHRRVPGELDLGVGEGAFLHDLGGPQLVTAVDDD